MKKAYCYISIKEAKTLKIEKTACYLENVRGMYFAIHRPKKGKCWTATDIITGFNVLIWYGESTRERVIKQLEDYNDDTFNRIINCISEAAAGKDPASINATAAASVAEAAGARGYYKDYSDGKITIQELSEKLYNILINKKAAAEVEKRAEAINYNHKARQARKDKAAAMAAAVKAPERIQEPGTAASIEAAQNEFLRKAAAAMAAAKAEPTEAAEAPEILEDLTICARYDANGERCHVIRYKENFEYKYGVDFNVTYNQERGEFIAGEKARGMFYIEDARDLLNQKRPGAIYRQSIAICTDCTQNDCAGTDHEQFTGCIYKSVFNKPEKVQEPEPTPEPVQEPGAEICARLRDQFIKEGWNDPHFFQVIEDGITLYKMFESGNIYTEAGKIYRYNIHPKKEEAKKAAAAKALERSMKKFERNMERVKKQAAAGVTIKLPKHAATNYKKLKPFIDAVNNNGGAVRFTSGADYMPLTIEKLYYKGPFNNPVYSIAHYGTQNGDAMRDPDITFEYIQEIGAIIPLSYRNDYINYFREVFRYDENGKPSKYDRREMTGEDEFLYTWLNNISAQGFTPDRCESIA